MLEVWFGIGGWISQLYIESKYNETQTADFLKVVLLHFKDLQGLSCLYAGVDTLYPSFSHSWTWWDTRDTPPGIVVGGFGKEQWLGRFYCISGIIQTPKEIGPNDSLQPTKDSEGILNTVKSICGEIMANPNKWSSILQLNPDEISLRATNFIKMHERATEKQKQVEAQELIAKPIDEKKVIEFKEVVTTAWQNSSELRDIAKKIGNYFDKSIVSEKVPLLGLQNLIPKNEFVKNPQTIVHGIDTFGQAMGRGEN